MTALRALLAAAILGFVFRAPAADMAPRQQTLVPLSDFTRAQGAFSVFARITPTNWTVCITNGARFGFSVAPAGDMNGDGHGDLMVGAPELDIVRDKAHHGAVFLFHGTTGGLSAAVGWKFLGERKHSQLGHSLVGLGDVNGDGYADVAAGAPRFDDPGVDSGICYIILGGPEMPAPKPVQFWEGGSRRIWLGWSVGRAGDMNKDGLDDFLVGAPLESLTANRTGAGLFYLGMRGAADQPMLWKPYWGMRGDASQSQFGRSIAGAGDVDGDGYRDIIVGASMHDKMLRQVGRALLFRGSPNGPLPTPSWAADGDADFAWFGAVVGGGVDVNRDGFSDVFVSAPGQNRAYSPWPGMVNIYTGSSTGLTRKAWRSLHSDQSGSRFGNAVDLGGDVNGDGWIDLLVGAPFYDAGKSDSGRVFLYLGSASGFRPEPDWVLNGGEAGAKCGMSVAWIGDQNRDGLSDFVVGTPDYARAEMNGGRVDVFFGSRTAYAAMTPGEVAAAKASTPRDYETRSTVGESAAEKVAVPRQGRFRDRKDWWLAVLVLIAGAGLVFWLRWRGKFQRKETAGAVEAERQRLARDLHDDLGARLTRITVLTELVRREAGSTGTGQQHARLLAETAREVLETMEQVIWSVNPANDTLENLVTFVIQYAGPFLAPAGMTLQADSPSMLPERTLHSDLRKNVFLCVKESLNNVVKHSQATEVTLRIDYRDPVLDIVIEDNGRGGVPDESRPGGNGNLTSDGLNNMRERMRSVGGQVSFEAGARGGTRVSLSVRV